MTWLRLLSVFVLLQLACAQLWPALHHALFTHAVCAEHGELVHAAADGHEPARPGAEKTSISAAGSQDDAHDHCRLPPGTHQPASEPADPSPVVAGVPAAEPAPLGPHESSCTVSILALAPKQGPPS